MRQHDLFDRRRFESTRLQIKGIIRAQYEDPKFKTG
jgi:hypothetical protein